MRMVFSIRVWDTSVMLLYNLLGCWSRNSESSVTAKYQSCNHKLVLQHARSSPSRAGSGKETGVTIGV